MSLLRTPIPASYIAVEEAVGVIRERCYRDDQTPVLKSEQFRYRFRLRAVSLLLENPKKRKERKNGRKNAKQHERARAICEAASNRETAHSLVSLPLLFLHAGLHSLHTQLWRESTDILQHRRS